MALVITLGCTVYIQHGHWIGLETHFESAYNVVLSQFCRISNKTSSVKSSSLNTLSSSSCTMNRFADRSVSCVPEARRFLLLLSFIERFASLDVDGSMSFISFIEKCTKFFIEKYVSNAAEMNN